MKHFLLIFILLLPSVVSAGELDEALEGKKYIFRLSNGDLITGEITRFIEDSADGKGAEVETEIGLAVIYEKQIRDIEALEESYRHSHRIFLMPTAHPIGRDHFIGVYELMFLYAGTGYSIFSLTAGRSFVPEVQFEDQATLINGKITFLDNALEAVEGYLTMAAGLNFTMINDVNKFYHTYLAATFTGPKTIFNINLFYKTGNKEIYDIRLIRSEFVTAYYPNGAFGLGLGLDTRISGRHDLHFIGELWNSDITRPSNTAILAGLRLAGNNFSADFGLALFTKPVILPFASFVWTPFN